MQLENAALYHKFKINVKYPLTPNSIQNLRAFLQPFASNWKKTTIINLPLFRSLEVHQLIGQWPESFD